MLKPTLVRTLFIVVFLDSYGLILIIINIKEIIYQLLYDIISYYII